MVFVDRNLGKRGHSGEDIPAAGDPGVFVELGVGLDHLPQLAGRSLNPSSTQGGDVAESVVVLERCQVGGAL